MTALEPTGTQPEGGATRRGRGAPRPPRRPGRSGRRRRRALLAALLAVLVAALVAVTIAYRRDLHEARARSSQGSQVAATACGPVEYALAGDRPALLVVHGAGGGFDQGLHALAPLVERGIGLLAVSRFGYLRTPLPADASAAAQADAHACVLDALGIDRIAIIGASAGAPSAMQFALRHPQRTVALVLLVPAAYAPRPDGAPSLVTPAGTGLLFRTALRWDLLFWLAPRLARATVLRAILATPPELVATASADEQARVERMIAGILPVSTRRDGLLNDAAVTSTLPRYALERIAAPTLVISLRDDQFGTWDGARYSAANIPGARFLGFPSGGHLWVGRQDEVMTAIATFLQATAAPPPAPP